MKRSEWMTGWSFGVLSTLRHDSHAIGLMLAHAQRRTDRDEQFHLGLIAALRAAFGG